MGWLWDAKAAATRAKLAAISAKPKKALGQNFVTDDSILARIVRESGVVAGDYVLEVGPGTGNLTKHLLKARFSSNRQLPMHLACVLRRCSLFCTHAPGLILPRFLTLL